MAARPSWQGQLRLSLVSCPVKLFTGTVVSERISFHTLSRHTHNRLRQQMYDPETGDVVEREDQVKGYEFEKGRFVVVEPDEVDSLRVESTQVIDIERFVDRSDIDTLYWDSPYYMVPDGKFAYEAFAVIREAIGRQDVVGIGRMVMANRERPVALQPRGNGILLNRLRSDEDVRRPEPIFEDIPDVETNEEMVSIAEQIIKRKHGAFDPSMFTDRYQAALHDLIKAKLEGAEPAKPKAPETGKVVNLFDALRASLEEGGGAPAKKPRAGSKKAAPASEKQRKRRSA